MTALDDLLAIPEAGSEALDPDIYVEPKDRDPASEESRQAAFVALMRRTCRACRVIAVPNAAKRSQWAAAKAKREGLLAGEPDTGITWADRHTARIEFKNGRDMPNPNQIEALNWYHRRGHPVAVCRTPEGAMRWLAQIGAPVARLL
jgi:hypothetical protein